jgi:hypothetical protein
MSDRTKTMSRPDKSTTVRMKMALGAVQTGLRLAHALPGGLGTAWSARLFTSPRRHVRPQREVALLASAQPMSLDVVTRASGRERAARIAAWRWGSGPTILLVHGWEGRGAQLGAVVPPLVDAGFSVMTFDAPAHGDSAGKRLVLADLAASIRAAERAAGGLHGIVAHSFGAASTTLALARGVDARRVVYLAPAVLLSRAVGNFARLTGVGAAAVQDLVAYLTRVNGFHPDDVLPEALAPRIDASLLTFHDVGDDEVPIEDGRRLLAAWSGAALVETQDLGHRRILRDPTVIERAVAFLTDGAAGVVRAPTPDPRAFVADWVAPIKPEQLVAMPR